MSTSSRSRRNSCPPYTCPSASEALTRARPPRLTMLKLKHQKGTKMAWIERALGCSTNGVLSFTQREYASKASSRFRLNGTASMPGWCALCAPDANHRGQVSDARGRTRGVRCSTRHDVCHIASLR